MRYIASCSGGKDSVAQLILAKEHGEPLDEVVYCEVMFSPEISGEMPEHRDFVYRTVKPFVEGVIGCNFRVLRAKRTYSDCFAAEVTRGKNIGKVRGYPLAGRCWANRDCKVEPITKFWKAIGDDVIQYVGIAADEPKRLERLRGTNLVSLLEKYNVAERDAKRLCEKYGMLSPVYRITSRNGCWFCPFCKEAEWEHMINKHEDIFDRLIDLENKYPDRAQTMLTYTETAAQLKRRILSYGEQMKLF